jgi:hypothetical protein
MKLMSSYLASGVVAIAAMIVGSAALAQSGHFLDRTVQCTDIGTQVMCTGKVAGLGGTTFQILVQAEGVASVECTNPGENVAPGQSKAITTLGDSGPLPTPRNGNFTFTLATAAPVAPADSCPNDQWTPTVVDVAFTTATLQLFEDGTLSDSLTVTVQ